ncbi:hypothetical protein [Maritimibacter fusiformis]|nr:hypothetical protein [Maritimibacter fusiformis]
MIIGFLPELMLFGIFFATQAKHNPEWQQRAPAGIPHRHCG